VLALEQARAERSLDPAQRSGQRRLTGPENSGRVGQVFGLREHDEPAKILDMHAYSVSISVICDILRMRKALAPS
jgi:hypothetical protein